MDQAVVDVSDLSRTSGREHAPDVVPFRGTAGQVPGRVGANGAAETTLITHLLGLLRPATGSVRVFGVGPIRESVSVLRRGRQVEAA